MEQDKEYYAFISYKREDEKWAKWLQHKLEHYKFPTNLNGRTDLPKRIYPTFRDVTDLTPGLLAEEIDTALRNSQWLIVVCSPRSAKSPWVCKEAQTFIDLGRTDHIIPFVIEGNPFSNDPDTECYPEALINLTGNQELLATNINEMGRDAAAIKVVARMFGLKFDTLWQRHIREHRKRRNRIIALAIFVLCALSFIVGYISYQNGKLKQISSRAAAKAATRLFEEGDSYRAQKVALAALDLSYTPEAEFALRLTSHYNSAILTGHTDEVVNAAVSSDGRFIVSSSLDGTYRIWERMTGKCIIILSREDADKEATSKSVDGKYIIMTDGYRGFFIEEKGLKNGDKISQCSFGNHSKDGKLIFSYSTEDSIITIVDAKTKIQKFVLSGHSGNITHASFSSDSKRIVSASKDRTIRIWDALTGQCLRIISDADVDVVSFSPDGKLIVTACDCWRAVIWDVKTGQRLKTLQHEDCAVDDVCFSLDGRYVMSVTRRGIYKWLMSSINSVDETNIKCEDEMFCEIINAFHPSFILPIPNEKDLILTASRGNALKIWDFQFKLLYGDAPFLESGRLYNIAFSPDGKRICKIGTLPGETEPYVKIWDIKSNKYVMTTKFPDYDPGEGDQSVSYSRDSKNVAIKTHDKIVIWDAISCTYKKTIHVHDVSSIAYLSDNNQLALSFNTDSDLRIWDIKGDRCVNVLKGHSDRITYIVCSPNGKYLATSSYDNTIRIWNIEKASCIKVLKGHRGTVEMIDYSPDGKLIVSAGDNTIRLWDAKTGKCIKVIDHYLNGRPTAQLEHVVSVVEGVVSVKFSPDGKYIVTVSSDDFMNVWDVNSGQCVLSYAYEAKYIGGYAKFCPNGKEIVLVTDDCGLSELLHFPSMEDLINKTKERFKNNPLTTDERRNYYLE